MQKRVVKKYSVLDKKVNMAVMKFNQLNFLLWSCAPGYFQMQIPTTCFNRKQKVYTLAEV